MARSIENTADAFIPLTDDSMVQKELEKIADGGRQAATAASLLYRLIAREAAQA